MAKKKRKDNAASKVAAAVAVAETPSSRCSHPLVAVLVGMVLSLSFFLMILANVGDGGAAYAPTADVMFGQAVAAWNGKLIDHVPYAEMSAERFMNEFQTKRKPVVITGMYSDSPLTEGVQDEGEDGWGWAAMRERFGDVLLDNRVLADSHSGFCTGAGLCEGTPIKMRDLLDLYVLHRRPKPRTHKPPPYPHDIELRRFLPDMFRVYRKSKLFAENLLLSVYAGTDRWPSLFLGAAGTRTNLQLDAMGSSSTMAVFRGRKQFLIFHPHDSPHLCMERPTPGLDYGVGQDPFHPDFHRCPEARTANALFANLGPGDILYLPGHVTYAERNLLPSVAIAQNFFTVNDYPAAMEDFGGYVAKLKRKQKDIQKQPVTLDFLAIRDFFRLLAETNFRSNWAKDKPFWDPDEASTESYKRITSHLTKVLQKDPTKYSTRLAYLCNFHFVILSLKAHGAWTCLGEQEKKELTTRAPRHNRGRDQSTFLDTLEHVFHKSGKVNMACREILNTYMNDVMNVQIPKAMKAIEEDRGLTSYCC